jgi:four helix bundle protein
MSISSYKELIVWQKSIDLVVAVYDLTKNFPREEIYGITSQMKRSAISIPSNIAEGSKRGTKKDYRHFLLNAFGSGAELETQIIISQKLGFCTDSNQTVVNKLLDEIMRMLNKMIQELGEF